MPLLYLFSCVSERGPSLPCPQFRSTAYFTWCSLTFLLIFLNHFLIFTHPSDCYTQSHPVTSESAQPLRYGQLWRTSRCPHKSVSLPLVTFSLNSDPPMQIPSGTSKPRALQTCREAWTGRTCWQAKHTALASCPLAPFCIHTGPDDLSPSQYVIIALHRNYRFISFS